MFMKKRDRRMSLRFYWTSRYVLTLLAGLTVIGFVAFWWIRTTTIDHNIELTQFFVEEMADRFTDTGEERPGPGFDALVNERGGRLPEGVMPDAFVTTTQGEVVPGQRGPSQEAVQQISPSLLGNDPVKTVVNDRDVYVISAPIEQEGETAGYVVMTPLVSDISSSGQPYGLLALMLISLALLGAMVIYRLSSRLAKPVQELSSAAGMISEGKYDIKLDENVKEEELYTLIRSFREMAEKLEKLEHVRYELLAGVTHDLKTPVTSIGGLLQGVRDGVVEGEEADEFIELSLKETLRLQQMIQGLLDFERANAGEVMVRTEPIKLHSFLIERIMHWINVQQEVIEMPELFLDESIFVLADPIHFEQALFNLLSNAVHAGGQKPIAIRVSKCKEHVRVEVCDFGRGIPEEEQPYVFERFFRGNANKLSQKGLGLGLPFSKMLMQKNKGDIELVSSSSAGTVMCIVLPYAKGE